MSPKPGGSLLWAERAAGVASVRHDRGMTDTCALCDPPAADAEFGRTLVWEDDLWRLSTSVRGHNTVAGFSFLEPKRHIPHITDLDGEEARTFGTAIGRCTAALKEATGAELVFVYVFGGGIPHLHVHLAPHVKPATR